MLIGGGATAAASAASTEAIITVGVDDSSYCHSSN